MNNQCATAHDGPLITLLNSEGSQCPEMLNCTTRFKLHAVRIPVLC
jgi:hypothetical protein